MEIFDIIDVYGRFFLKVFFINIYLYLVYIKITNYKNNSIKKVLIIILSSLIISTIYMILTQYITPLLVMPLLYMIYGIVISNIVKQKFNYSIFVVTISFILTYMVYFFSVIISGIVLMIVTPNISYKHPISLLTIPFIMIIIYYFILKIKRLKNGLNFLKDVDKIEKIGRFINIAFLTTIIIFAILQDSEDTIINTVIFLVTVFATVILINWILAQITKTYKTKMRDRTIEIQKTEIDEKSRMIEEIKSENLKLATAIHKYNHKFEALELAMKNSLKKESKTEFAEELSVILKEAKETSKNFAEATKVNTVKLPETNIVGIDNMLKYMQEEARKNNINFDLKINTKINSLIDNIIPKEKLEILIGDHLKDAIIAVNSSEKSYKSILVILGLVDGVYEFSIYDTGIEFEIDTLLKLGKEQVTTHKETGGSGIGFMTTFETLKQCKGSLIIEEYNPETTSYTKSVTIRFDGKNKYKISSYRAEKIKEQKTKRRIIIQKLK